MKTTHQNSTANGSHLLDTDFAQRGRFRGIGAYPTWMKRSTLAVLFLLPGLAACGGGVGGSRPAVLPQAASAPLASDSVAREAQSDSMQVPAATFAPSSTDLLYVANGTNNSITVYHTDASGDAAPLAVIKGSKTQLNNPGQLSGDANGDLYVTNVAANDILVFKHGANGNVAPLRVIAGPRTGLSSPNNLEAVTVDQTTGKIFAMVVDAGTPNAYAELIRFPPNASGDAVPYAVSSPDFENAFELASDSTGNNIIDASYGHCCSGIYNGIYTYPKQFFTGGGAAIYGISDFVASAVADDPATKTYLVAGNDSRRSGIFRFKEDTVGNGGYFSLAPPSYTPALVSFLTVPNACTLAPQLALGYLRNIYVSCASNAIYVYEHDASGNAKPLRILTGSKTKLDGPYGIYEGK